MIQQESELDRAKEQVENFRKIIQEFYGLETVVVQWYMDNKPPGAILHILTPTKQTIGRISLNFEENGFIIPEEVSFGKNYISGKEEVILAIRKLMPPGHQYRLSY